MADLLAAGAMAQPVSSGAPRNFPAKPVHLVVPFAPAGAGDLFGRTVAQRYKEAWGQEVVVENRGGAGGTIGAGYVAKSAPDGYTLLLGNLGVLAINPAPLARSQRTVRQAGARGFFKFPGAIQREDKIGSGQMG